MTFLLASAVSAAALDLLSKQVAMRRLRTAGGVPHHRGWFSFQLVKNRRGALIAMPRGVASALWLAASAAMLYAVHAAGPLSPRMEAGLGLVAGGAAGNLIERLMRGGVTDFLAVGNWPVFNLADAAMVCGALLALLGLA